VRVDMKNSLNDFRKDEVLGNILRLTRILNEHLSENPKCSHDIKYIAREAFGYDNQ
jgi:hypothetical protein